MPIRTASHFSGSYYCQLTLQGFQIRNDRPENTFTIGDGAYSVFPDHGLDLVGPYGRHFRLYFEFDRSTETERSSSEARNTWAHKIQAYEAEQDRLGRNERFRVVVVTEKSRERSDNILSLFAEQTRNPNRQLLLGVFVEDFLSEDDPLCHRLFADHRQEQVALIPSCAINLPPRPVWDPLALLTTR